MKATEGDARGSGVPSREAPPGRGTRTRPPEPHVGPGAGSNVPEARPRRCGWKSGVRRAEGGHAIASSGGSVSWGASDGQFLMETSDGSFRTRGISILLGS